MPLYRWKDSRTGKAVEILRSFEEYQDTPDREEALAGGLTEEEIEAAEWTREIGAGIQVVRGSNWQGSKGNW